MPPDDDSTISDEDRLFRRIPSEWIIWDANKHAVNVSSGAFSNSSDGSGMSVSIESVMEEKGLCIPDILHGYEKFGLVAITAGLARKNGQGVIKSPTHRDLAHGEVTGKKRSSVKKAFKRNAEWIICPPSSEED